MCLIFVAKEGVPTLDVMERAEKGNNDGAGIAWVQQTPDKKSTEVCWKKNLKAKEIHELFNDFKLEKSLPDYPFIIHFRSVSSGGLNPHLCQPFPIEKEVSSELEGRAKSVLFHNGTYGRWDDDMKTVCFAGGAYVPGGPWNDSRFLAWLAFNRGIGALWLTNNGGYSGGVGGRIAILNSTGKLYTLGNGWIDGEQKGVKQSGHVTSSSQSPIVWQGQGHHRGMEEEKFKILRPIKSSLYEEGDSVRVFSKKEYEGILEEIHKDQEEFLRAC